ncbi:MAG: protoporphyrinogen oxidase [Gemmatimonadales bacterium]|nr:protoporphyrinogen oxidase [Gemmatimonadales bacterium]
MAAVAVVGAGVAGLAAAFRLRRRGVRVVVYESSGRVGGSILTERRDGYVADLGPNSLAAPSPMVRTLFQELDLESNLVTASSEARHRYIVRKGKLVALPISPPELLTTRLLSNGAKLAVFGEPLVEAGDSRVEESVGTFVRRRFNQEVLDYVANPFVAGMFAGDPEQLSVRYALPRLHALERSHGSVIKAFVQMMRARRGDEERGGTLVSFKSGLQELPDALARELGSAVRLGVPVTQLKRGPKGWTVGAAFQTSELYDGVIFAAPAHCIDDVDLGFEGAERVKTLASIHHPPVGVLVLGFRREQVSHPLDGFGFLTPEVERRSVLGVIFSSTLFAGRAPEGHCTLTAFVGGVRNPDLANADLNTITARVLDDLGALLGVDGEPTFRTFHLWPKAIPQYTLSHGRFKDIMDEVERGNPGLAFAGAYRDGVALGEVLASGEEAAERTAERLGAREHAEPA